LVRELKNFLDSAFVTAVLGRATETVEFKKGTRYFSFHFSVAPARVTRFEAQKKRSAPRAISECRHRAFFLLLLPFLVSGRLGFLVTRKVAGAAKCVNDEQEQNNFS